MKKLDRFILKSFTGPFILAFALAVFVLLMQILWKHIDDLVGKGLSLSIIFQWLYYLVLTLIPTALPIGCLFSSIMVMGSFGERYELIAMKSSGISLTRCMLPIALFIVLIAFASFGFSNNVIPYANLKQKTLLNSITRQKPALNIKEGEYYKDIDGYVIRVHKKDKDGKSLKGITIYDHTEGMGNISVTYAKSGEMFSSEDGKYLIFNLFDGYNFQEEIRGENAYKRPLTRTYFKEQFQRFDLSSFAFSQLSEELFKNSYQMMSLGQLLVVTDTLNMKLDERRLEVQTMLKSRYSNLNNYYSDTVLLLNDSIYDFYTVFDSLQTDSKEKIKKNAITNARSVNEDVISGKDRIRGEETTRNRHVIEINKKFSLPLACIILFMIGAPFGSITRKGGLGLPLVMSVLIFLLYHILTITFEKSFREGAMGLIALWIPTLILTPFGLFLTLKATVDSPLFDLDSWKKKLKKWFYKGGKENECTAAM